MTMDGTDGKKPHEIEYETNPFWDGMKIQTRMKRTGVKGDQKVVVDLKTGMYEGMTEVSKVYEVDSEQFIKVFVLTMMVFFEVENSGRKVLEYAMMQAAKTPNSDSVYLQWQDCQRYHLTSRGNINGVSRSAFYRGIAELAAKGIIGLVAAKPNYWWFNPSIFFNGDRVAFRTEMRKAAQILDPITKTLPRHRKDEVIDHLAAAFGDDIEEEALPEIIRMAAE